MALGDSYATTAELKTRIDITDSTDDTRLDEALAVASRWIERHCRRQFNKTTTASARVYHPDTATVTVVGDFHTTTDLVIATGSGDGSYDTTWSTSEYGLEPLNGIVDGEMGWPYYRILGVRRTFSAAGLPTLQVTAQWGWASVPPAVKEACLIAAEETYKLADAPFGVAGFGDFGPIRVRDNPKAVALLAPYRRLPVLVG